MPSEKSDNNRTKLRLRVRELAEARDITMVALGRKANIGAATIQRYWHNSSWLPSGVTPLENVSLKVLEAIAAVLDVHPRELIAFEDELKKETSPKG